MSHPAAVQKIVASPLRSFTPVPGAPDVHFSFPLHQFPFSPDVDQPTVILLFAWMDAPLPRIFEYTETYNRLFPGATQIIVQSRPSMFWQAENVQIEYFQPAMKLLRDCGIIYPSNDDRLLIHAFSNGGCVKLTTLAKAIRRHHPFALKESSALQARAVIMDSCPGKIGLFRGIRAFSAAIRNRLLRYLAKCIIGSILIFAVAYYRITRLPDLFEVMQRDLLDPTLLPFTSHRAYIYSNNDALIAVSVVEAHAQVARNKGIPVRLEKYERTTHVGHMRANSVRYWDIVRDTWEDGKYGKSLEWPDKGPKDLQSPKVRAPL